MDHVHELDPCHQVEAKPGMVFAVLVLRTWSYAVVEDRFEAIIIGTPDVRALVDGESCGVLAYA
jgi:hypothetical protein